MTFFPKFTSWPVQLDPAKLARNGRQITTVGGPPTPTVWGTIIGSIGAQADLVAALVSKVTRNPAIIPATKTKITYDSQGLVTAGADATTADIADSLNKRYVTDAELVDIGTIAGKLTGNVAIVAATKTKISYDTKGLVTAGADATTADIADSVNKRYCTDAEKTTITLSGKKDFTYEFSFCDNLAVGEQISIGCNHRTITLGGESTWQNNGLGVYIPTAQRIVSICYCVPFFLSNNVAHQTTYDFREITADGSLTSDPTGASGSSIHTYSFVYANASGVNRYYKCLSQTGLAIDINPGKMLTVWVSSQNVSACHGVSIQVQTRES